MARKPRRVYAIRIKDTDLFAEEPGDCGYSKKFGKISDKTWYDTDKQEAENTRDLIAYKLNKQNLIVAPLNLTHVLEVQ
jgi:hypothetical protein